jgi:beta-phosphoglucomutase
MYENKQEQDSRGQGFQGSSAATNRNEELIQLNPRPHPYFYSSLIVLLNRVGCQIKSKKGKVMTATNNNIKAILFDMDGVLVDSMNYHMESWKQLLETFGIYIAERFIYEHEGAMGLDIIQELFHKTGLSIDGNQVMEIYDQQNRIFREEYLGMVRLYPETLTLIEEFQQRGLRLGLVTSSRMNLVEQIWEDYQCLNRFDTIVTADDVTRFKPNPDPYLRALEKLEQEPESCLVIENAPAGIEAAKAAGLLCYAVTTTLPRESLSRADKIFPNLASLRTYLNNLLI